MTASKRSGKCSPQIPAKKLATMLQFSKDLVQVAGGQALSYFGRSNVKRKYDHDLVTEADVAVQELIRKEVKAAFPEHQFLGEEDEQAQPACDLRQPMWVVDPVDGSAAFSAGLPVWGVSIALFDGMAPVLGVIFLPVTRELYAATVGTPATLNDKPIRVRDETIDDESLLLTFSRFHGSYRTHFPGKVRSMGSTVAHIAYVARGAACGAVVGNVRIWDLAAGQVILEAAGGCLRDLMGKRVDLSAYLGGDRIGCHLIAAATGTHQEIVETLKGL